MPRRERACGARGRAAGACRGGASRGRGAGARRVSASRGRAAGARRVSAGVRRKSWGRLSLGCGERAVVLDLGKAAAAAVGGGGSLRSPALPSSARDGVGGAAPRETARGERRLSIDRER